MGVAFTLGGILEVAGVLEGIDPHPEALTPEQGIQSRLVPVDLAVLAHHLEAMEVILLFVLLQLAAVEGLASVALAVAVGLAVELMVILVAVQNLEVLEFLGRAIMEAIV